VVISLTIVTAGAIAGLAAQAAPPPRQAGPGLPERSPIEVAESNQVSGGELVAETVGILRLAHFRSVLTAFWVRRAVNDAARRLQQPDCRRVLTDFTDQSGNLLSANLSRLAMTPAEFVERALLFVDAGEEGPCLSDSRAAFTAPGSRVIYVCTSRLILRGSGPNAKMGLVIIHEALHALGLGENPPPSAQISQQVTRRCDS
jgi:hypothetical protein